MRSSAPIQVIIHPPSTEEGRQELARRVSEVHADFVIRTLNQLNCPMKQKLELLQAVMDTAKGTYKAPQASKPEPERNRQKNAGA